MNVIEIVFRTGSVILAAICTYTWFTHCFVQHNSDSVLWLAAFCYFGDAAIYAYPKKFWERGSA